MNSTEKHAEFSAYSKSLGIIYYEESGRGLTHPFFALILNAFINEAEARGYDITFIHPAVIQDESACVEHCRQSLLSGICFVCVDFELPGVLALAESSIPCVTVDHMFRHVPAVLSDNETGVQKLVEYAISRGHTRIAFIHGQNNSIVTRTRIRQFHNVMAYHNLPVPKDYIREGRYNDIELTRNIVRELLRLPDRPTCILLPDDISYLGAQDAAREFGLRIPADIAFAGYDCIPLTQTLEPRLTTIRQSADEMGKTAAQMLIELVKKPERIKRFPRILPVELVVGGTL